MIPNSKIFLLAIFIFSVLFLGFERKTAPTLYQYPDLFHFPKMIPTNNPPTIEGVELGRYLFYDPILSKDSTFSCASCHKQAYAFSDAPQTFSTGINGNLGKRNTMPLFNLQWYANFFWDGKANTLEEQVLHPVRSHDEMDLNWEQATYRINNSNFYTPKFQAAFGNQKIDSITISKAIAQFERTLISHNSKYDQVIRGEAYFTPQEYEGFNLINDQTKGNCLHCHTTDANALGTTAGFSNNGLDNFTTPSEFIDKGKGNISNQLSDIGRFKIPSLRNVGITFPYMHDGRFKTLEEVLDFYTHGINYSYNIDPKMENSYQVGLNLTALEKENIVLFLHTLTDSVFLTNPNFSNPFLLNNK
ncbi:MAG: cytochrome-c peroxidase [Saprospiraceae bacterium]